MPRDRIPVIDLEKSEKSSIAVSIPKYACLDFIRVGQGWEMANVLPVLDWFVASPTFCVPTSLGGRVRATGKFDYMGILTSRHGAFGRDARVCFDHGLHIELWFPDGMENHHLGPGYMLNSLFCNVLEDARPLL